MDLGLLDVHVQAETAAVDLRCADIDQRAQFLDHRDLLQRHAVVEILLGQGFRHLEIVQSLAHGHAFLMGCGFG
ncbi:hypothetical protein D3C72_2041330 [compost metagenome]